MDSANPISSWRSMFRPLAGGLSVVRRPIRRLGAGDVVGTGSAIASILTRLGKAGRALGGALSFGDVRTARRRSADRFGFEQFAAVELAERLPVGGPAGAIGVGGEAGADEPIADLALGEFAAFVAQHIGLNSRQIDAHVKPVSHRHTSLLPTDASRALPSAMTGRVAVRFLRRGNQTPRSRGAVCTTGSKPTTLGIGRLAGKRA
jgi:hypothetical protein